MQLFELILPNQFDFFDKFGETLADLFGLPRVVMCSCGWLRDLCPQFQSLLLLLPSRGGRIRSCKVVRNLCLAFITIFSSIVTFFLDWDPISHVFVLEGWQSCPLTHKWGWGRCVLRGVNSHS